MCSQITILNWKIELERFGWFTVNVFYYRKSESEWIRRWKIKETFLKQFRVLKIGHKGRWVEIVVVPYLTSHHCALCRCWWWFQGQRSKYKVSKYPWSWITSAILCMTFRGYKWTYLVLWVRWNFHRIKNDLIKSILI